MTLIDPRETTLEKIMEKNNEAKIQELYIKATDGSTSKEEQAKNWEKYWTAKHKTN